MKNLIFVLALVFGAQSVFAEKIITPKKDTNKQNGGSDTGGGEFITGNMPQPLNKNYIQRYLDEAREYLPYVIRYIDYYMSTGNVEFNMGTATHRRKGSMEMPDGTRFIIDINDENYEKLFGSNKVFTSTRDQSSVYDVLKFINFKLQDICLNKEGNEVASSVANEKANDVCVSKSKIMSDSKLDTRNVVASLVALLAHEVMHKVGFEEEFVPTWVQLIVLKDFRPTTISAQFVSNSWEMLEKIKERNKVFVSILSSAGRGKPSSSCYKSGFNLVDEVRAIDTKMRHAYEQGIGYLSYEAYISYITALHISIYAGSFCMDDEDIKGFLFSNDSDESEKDYVDFIKVKPGESIHLSGHRQKGTIYSWNISTTKVGLHDVENLRKVYWQTKNILEPLIDELEDLVQQSDRLRSGGTK